MSNKTQLQTNNVALDGYIARINAAKEVAAGLPEAGGSNQPEFCEITFSFEGDIVHDAYIWYLQAFEMEGEIVISDHYGPLQDFVGVTTQVLKNSYLFISHTADCVVDAYGEYTTGRTFEFSLNMDSTCDGMMKEIIGSGEVTLCSYI